MLTFGPVTGKGAFFDDIIITVRSRRAHRGAVVSHYLLGWMGGGKPEWMKYRDPSQCRKRADGEPAAENIGVAQAYLLCDTLYIKDFD